ncbi:hypothetical protein MCEMSE6_01280 [Oxalobacteraceae bacterium]|jgi:hypothetical protein
MGHLSPLWEGGMEWVIVGMEVGVALVIAIAVYITMKK